MNGTAFSHNDKQVVLLSVLDVIGEFYLGKLRNALWNFQVRETADNWQLVDKQGSYTTKHLVDVLSRPLLPLVCHSSGSAASSLQQDIYSSAPPSSLLSPPLLVWCIHPICLNTDVYFGRRSGLDSLKPSSCTSQSQPNVTVFADVVEVHIQVSAWGWRHHCRNMRQHGMYVTVLKFIAELINSAAAAAAGVLAEELAKSDCTTAVLRF